jgi:hypothetical protein
VAASAGRACTTSKGTVLGMLTTAQDALLTEVHLYVSSPEGQRRIGAALERRRLPSALDTDIEEAVLSEARRFILNGGSIGSVSGWCNARVAARSIDLSRGVIRREKQLGVQVDVIELEDVAESPSGPIDGDLRDLRLDVLLLDERSEDISAALTFITRVADEAQLTKQCPQPEAGATTTEAAVWAGLWYAGRHECFGGGNTITKRRSRAMARIRALFEQHLRDSEEGKC